MRPGPSLATISSLAAQHRVRRAFRHEPDAAHRVSLRAQRQNMLQEPADSSVTAALKGGDVEIHTIHHGAPIHRWRRVTSDEVAWHQRHVLRNVVRTHFVPSSSSSDGTGRRLTRTRPARAKLGKTGVSRSGRSSLAVAGRACQQRDATRRIPQTRPRRSISQHLGFHACRLWFLRIHPLSRSGTVDQRSRACGSSSSTKQHQPQSSAKSR
ncbi:hypothetical protein BKA81DRAFT_372387 [Phyllosticta paracitricarpa]